MLVKIIIILFMLVILGCLGSSLFYLVRDRGTTTRTVKALSWRVGISLTLFILLLIGFSLGIITPHQVG